MTSGIDWPRQITPDPSIHTPPNSGGPPVKLPFTDRQIKAFIDLLLNSILGRVALALSGLTVLGQQPFAWLAAWGQARIAEAQANYVAATLAQSAANYANAQLAILSGIGMASDVPGGVALSAVFNGAAATDFGASWTRTTAGSGAGSYGPNGSNVAAWNRSGGLAYTLFDRHNTALATDYQGVAMVLAALPQQPDIFGGQAYNFLRARSNTSNDTFVYARIGYNSLRVGCYVSGVETVFDSISIDPDPGDSWALLVGTDVDDYEIIVKRNSQIIWRDTDAGPISQMGGSFLHVGTAEAANGRLIFTQTVPGEMAAWAAADRLPATV